MSQFLKLKAAVINTRQITKIITWQDKHYIFLNSQKIDGLFSFITSEPDIIEVCKNRHTEEYTIVSNFIDSLPD